MTVASTFGFTPCADLGGCGAGTLVASPSTYAGRTEAVCCGTATCAGNAEEGGGLLANPLVEVAAFAASFVGLAIVCDDHMVVALETLCVRWNVPEDVAGASFLAVGSAAPEIVINAIGVYKAHRVGAGGETTSAAAQREANSALQLGLSELFRRSSTSYAEVDSSVPAAVSAFLVMARPATAGSRRARSIRESRSTRVLEGSKKA